jgi:hypothetical protein
VVDAGEEALFSVQFARWRFNNRCRGCPRAGNHFCGGSAASNHASKVAWSFDRRPTQPTKAPPGEDSAACVYAQAELSKRLTCGFEQITSSRDHG